MDFCVYLWRHNLHNILPFISDGNLSRNDHDLALKTNEKEIGQRRDFTEKWFQEKMAGNSSDDSFADEWVFYKDREDWKDVIPIPKDDGPTPVVQIAYSDKCKSPYTMNNTS